MTITLRWLFALLILAVAACSDPSETGAPEPVELEQKVPGFAPLPDNEEADTERSLGDPWVGDLDGMKERRVIRVLTVYSVGRYYIDAGREKGLIKEAAMLFDTFINKGGKQKHIKTRVVIVPVARDQLIPYLLRGWGDIVIASLSITPERQSIVDFSIPASKPISEILLTGPSARHLDSIDDLAGETIYVRQSSSYRESVETLNERFRREGRALVDIEPVSEHLEDDDLIEMVSKGLLPWAVVDDYKMDLWKDHFTNVVARNDIVFRSGGQTAWAIRKGSPQLEKAINDFLKKNREGTLVGNVLMNRYVRDFDWAENALARDEFGRFRQLEAIFRKYGEKYEVDHLLAAAQGFQESRLDQEARSAAGAIGVMQLLPSTAKDPNVDISKIDNVDNNIHAGIKYVNFLRARYFSDPDISELDQTLLALAAYNVGPRRMINLRNKAEKLGYDRNVWFDNVELAAARDVGREPVQYVANIYKYYIAYRYSIEELAKRSEARERAGIDG